MSARTDPIRLWLTPYKPIPCPDYVLTTAGYRPPLGTGVATAEGVTYYSHAGLGHPEEPAPYFGSPPDPNVFQWHFSEFMTTDAGARNPAGWVDGIFGVATNTASLVVVGPGTATVYTRQHPRGPGNFGWRLQHRIPGSIVVVDNSGDNIAAGTTFDIVVPDDGFCVHWIELDTATNVGAGPGNPGGAAFDGWDWDPA